jgi:hypothetical protein
LPLRQIAQPLVEILIRFHDTKVGRQPEDQKTKSRSEAETGRRGDQKDQQTKRWESGKVEKWEPSEANRR